VTAILLVMLDLQVNQRWLLIYCHVLNTENITTCRTIHSNWKMSAKCWTSCRH